MSRLSSRLPRTMAVGSGTFAESSLVKDSPKHLFRSVAISLLSVTVTPPCFRGPIDGLLLVFCFTYAKKGLLFPPFPSASFFSYLLLAFLIRFLVIFSCSINSLLSALFFTFFQTLFFLRMALRMSWLSHPGLFWFLLLLTGTCLLMRSSTLPFTILQAVSVSLAITRLLQLLSASSCFIAAQ